ncbi:phospholipid carrier-dependent glycosyltransferase [Candidatus Daviesbacteria bacterium]|nr:phospholipid carrier-dependent glycosyltransferase [Candidatus Daviesbacteria bacterium]
MYRKFLKPRTIFIVIIIFAAFFRLYRLDYPNKYIFDEVYHAYTAKEYLKGNKEAWSPWGKSTEEGTAFEWLHPPVSKEIMTASMFILKNTDAWAWRLPGALLGILSVILVYKLASLLFKNAAAAIFSALIFSIDGLNFVQSRIGMNDIYLVTFILASVIFFVRKNYLLSAIFTGIAISTKWPGVFLMLIYFPILIDQRQFKNLIFFVLILPAIYLLSYTPYFLIGYTWSDFIQLHKQIWWYQTHLKATHDYASPWWSWPLNLYPIWYFVDYIGESVANIFASGNPAVFLIGIGSLLLTLIEGLRKKLKHLLLIVALFLVFWLPWAISPRIMFLYHFSPSVPFLCLAIGYQLNTLINKGRRKTAILLLALMIFSFALLFPFLTGIPLSKNLTNLFFFTNLAKNPF